MTKKRTDQITVRFEPELREKLQRAADREMRPLAGMIRKILHDATKLASRDMGEAA